MSTKAAVREELWQSFVSMVKVYTEARNVAGPLPWLSVDDSRNSRVVVARPGRSLSLEYDPLDGTGRWTVLDTNSEEGTLDHVAGDGPIRLELEGFMLYNERRLDFDMAAIELLATFDSRCKTEGRKTEGDQGR